MKFLIPVVCLLMFTACERSAEEAPEAGIAGSPAAEAGSADSAAAPQAVSKQLTAQVFQFGTYTPSKKGRISDSSETNTGKVIRKPELVHLKMVDHIPLEMDTYFGFQYRLWNLPPEAMVKRFMDLRRVLIHPPMSLPDGTTSSGWDRPFRGRVKSGQIIGFDGYAFNEDYELVEGDWIFQIWYQDRKLVERKFVSVRPDTATVADAAATE